MEEKPKSTAVDFYCDVSVLSLFAHVRVKGVMGKRPFCVKIISLQPFDPHSRKFAIIAINLMRNDRRDFFLQFWGMME